MTTTKIVGIGLLVGGVVLLAMAFQSTDSFSEQLKLVAGGDLRNKTAWLAVGGALGCFMGISSIYTPVRSRHS